MRALGGAITSLALTTRKAGAPHLQSLDCPPICCLIAGCIGLANTDNGTLWETAGRILCLYLACTVATSLQNNMHREFFC